ncbi:hypothetical protein G7Y89_g9229 [Cudoniella acicularis]|uniref:Uncharacterized protein n=1 Tax=Cudoniella acicularis TaxID=354080 RepID=A0A8H4RGL6_9HELO|nr:hypothetical protein G7Y89_g9229 [Cudoniella acicularis]
MFSFNAGQQLPTLKEAHRWWQYEDKGKLIIEFLSSLPRVNQSSEETTNTTNSSESAKTTDSKRTSADDVPTEQDLIDQFMDFNHDLLFDTDFQKQRRRSNQGFPPQFIQDLCLKKVFLKDYQEVDFDQSLTCLDYLRDLECTRRDSLSDAATSLGITKDNWRTILLDDPDAYSWVRRIQKQELELETFYADVFIDLRIWTMVHELQATPFYKPNVLAMLNTLFPPSMKEMPNDRIDIKLLEKYRNTFYRHILAVESKGAGILKEFIDKLMDPGTKHSWPRARNNLEAYIDLADKMIKEANGVHHFKSFRQSTSNHSRGGSNTHSSFSDRPRTASSANTSFDGNQSASTTPKSPSMPPDSFSIRSRIFSRKRTSNPQEVPIPNKPLPLLPTNPSIEPGPPAAREGASKFPQLTRPVTHENTLTKSRPRTLSKPKRPLLASTFEGSNEEESSPISPLGDYQKTFDLRKQMLSDKRPSSASIISGAAFNEIKSRDFAYSQSEDSDITIIATKNTLAYEKLDFLNRPYQPTTTEPTLKPKTSLGSLFNRRKSSFETPARNPEKKGPEPPKVFPLLSEPIPLAKIELDTETLSSRKLTKQKSMNFLERTNSKREGRASTWGQGATKEQEIKRKRSFSSGLKSRATKAREAFVRKEMISEPLPETEKEMHSEEVEVRRPIVVIPDKEFEAMFERAGGEDESFLAPRVAPVPEEKPKQFTVDVSRFSKY